MRKLTWAATARQRTDWEIASNQMAWFARCTTGERVDPRELNPFARCDPVRVASEINQGWAMLDRAARQRGGG